MKNILSTAIALLVCNTAIAKVTTITLGVEPKITNKVVVVLDKTSKDLLAAKTYTVHFKYD